MKQKIVIKVDMHCQKCRSKAMEIAAVSDAKDSYEGGYALCEMPIEGYGDRCSFPWSGVISVAIEGKDLDLLVVTGNEVDSPCLIKQLRKKVGCADLVTIAEVKPKSPEKPKPPPCPAPTCCSGCSPPCPGPIWCPPPCPGPICLPPPCPGPICRPPPCPVSCNKSPPKCQGTCCRQPSVSEQISEYGPNCSFM